MTDKENYREFCKIETNIPIFSKDWWLDSVCGKDNWDVALVKKEGTIIASMPYYEFKKGIFNVISMPKLTQTMGPYIKYPQNQKYGKKLSFEKKVMFELIEKLPKNDYFCQNFHYSITNWLPFYWKEYKQTTRYTYVIEDLNNLNQVYANFHKSNRKLINKASKNLQVYTDNNIELFYKINQMSFKRQNTIIPYSLEYVKRIDQYCKEFDARTILFAKDKQNNIHGVMYIIYDNLSLYCLMGGGDPKFRSSGAKNLINVEAMKLASQKKIKFDFEGSMMENVENFYRQFSAVQKPYFQITKTNSKLLKIRNFFREFIK